MKMTQKEGMNRSWNRANPTDSHLCESDKVCAGEKRPSLTLTCCPSDDDVRGGKRHICVARDPIDNEDASQTFTSDSYKLKFLEDKVKQHLSKQP